MSPDDVELERAVVLEEIAMRADDPEDLLGEVFDDALFGDHPLGRPVIGSEESIESMTRDRLYGFWRRHYGSRSLVVAAAGRLDHGRVVDLVAQRFPTDGWTASAGSDGSGVSAGAGAAERPVAPSRDRRPPLTLPAGHDRLAVLDEDTEQAHLMVGMPSLNRYDPRCPALDVLNTVLGGGMSSRLFQQIREQRGLAYAVYSATTGYSDAGELAVYAGCQPARLGEVAALVGDVLSELAADGPTGAELARAKGALRGGLVLGLEDTASRMHRIGRHEIDLGHQRSLAESLAMIEQVDAGAVAELATEVLSQPLTAAVVGPYATPGELPGDLRDLVDRA
jgi:predicted Zn-dependent peptidase